MSSVDDLKQVLKEALDNKGVTNEIQSKLRSEVFSILEDNTYEKPRVSQENLLINELIRDYMDFNHYKYSKSVFLKESNQPAQPLNREVIASELHIKETKTTRQVPLLYSLLWNSLNEDPVPEYEEKLPKSSNYSHASKQSDKTSNKNINIYKYNTDHFDL